ncbi:MAG TPA: alpha/beta hydrolase [Nitriliruptorales bacterium]|nr:alpha/beta hydrolase [Nitriliruptorales bacterium]
MDGQHAVIDGVPIRWEAAGDGPPVVLLHGIPTGPDLWRHVTPRLQGVRVLAFEMVGYGQSIPAGEGRDISVAAQARYVGTWLDHLGIERAVLVGHDLGGGVAQIAAVHRPERCAGLVLTNSIAYDSWPIPSVKLLRATAPVAAHAPNAVLKAVLAVMFARGHDDLRLARESLEVHHRHYARRGGAAALARQVTALDVRDTLSVAERLTSLDMPAQIVWGVADQFQKPEYGERLARDLGARAVAIRDGKHYVPEDHPDIVARAIHDVVAAVDIP